MRVSPGIRRMILVMTFFGVMCLTTEATPYSHKKQVEKFIKAVQKKTLKQFLTLLMLVKKKFQKLKLINQRSYGKS